MPASSASSSGAALPASCARRRPRTPRRAVVQDELLQPYFNFGPGFIDWQAHISSVADDWCHVVLYAPDYQIDTIENHRPLYDRDPFTPELFDRWLQIFHDTIDGGWSGPRATTAKKEAWVMAWGWRG